MVLYSEHRKTRGTGLTHQLGSTFNDAAYIVAVLQDPALQVDDQQRGVLEDQLRHQESRYVAGTVRLWREARKRRSIDSAAASSMSLPSR